MAKARGACVGDAHRPKGGQLAGDPAVVIAEPFGTIEVKKYDIGALTFGNLPRGIGREDTRREVYDAAACLRCRLFMLAEKEQEFDCSDVPDRDRLAGRLGVGRRSRGVVDLSIEG